MPRSGFTTRPGDEAPVGDIMIKFLLMFLGFRDEYPWQFKGCMTPSPFVGTDEWCE